ncbi:MAG: DNA binding protein [Alectoria sarmentosa]|nr:MAG: DNA binding protein [Alectoria sarmentosa]
MAQTQRHRAPKLKTVHCVHQEDTSPAMPEAISLQKEDQVVEEKQSYAMVTGLIQILVANIAYQRSLFPKSCFEMWLPSLVLTDAHQSYEQADGGSHMNSSNNEMAHFATALAQRDQPFMVLAPGKINAVDKLLVWLDEIFEGLLDRSLDGFQFSIYADKSRPSEILELYTFSFQYHDGKDGERRLVGLMAPGRDSGMITTRNVRSRMVNVIDQLNKYQQQLPTLPRERYLMCHLFHSPYAPRHHRPPGFHTCADTNMAVIENGLWYMKPRRLGSIDSGVHSMRLDIGFMARTDTTKDLDDRPVLAQNMEYTKFVSRALKPDLEMRPNINGAGSMSAQMTKSLRGGFTRADEQGDATGRASLHDGAEGLDRSMRAKGQSISQGPLGDKLRESVGIHDTLSGDSLLPTQVMDAHDPPALTWNWKLRAGKDMEMAVKRDKQQWIAALDDRVVRCECSSDREESSMLQCICCHKLQHYHCYGFALETHAHEHYCYKCLLEDTHGSKLEDMKSYAIFRRALWILYEKTPSSPEEFAQELNFNGKTTRGLIKRLDEGGYLASGTTQLSPVITPQQLMFRSQLYYNPLTCISGFYELQENTTRAITDTEDENPRRKRIKT